jgi:hypothetical protein
MSQSSRPMRAPCWAMATARLTAVVDLPTPPLPEATATIARTPGIPDCCCVAPRPPAASCALAGPCALAPEAWRSAVSTAVTDKTPGKASTAVSQARRTGSLASPSSGATSTAKPTLPSRMTTPEIMPSSTTSRPLSGSITPVSASKTICFVSVAMRFAHCAFEDARVPGNIPPKKSTNYAGLHGTLR